LKSLAYNPNNDPNININTFDDSKINLEEISEKSKMVSQNWFLKTSIIREVLPRRLKLLSYVELALVKCYAFYQRTQYAEILSRIALSINGVSEPLTAVYIGMYLARVGFLMKVKSKDYLLLLLEMVSHKLNRASIVNRE